MSSKKTSVIKNGRTTELADNQVSIGGTTYTVKPFTFDQLKTLLPAIAGLRAGNLAEVMPELQKVVAVVIGKKSEELDGMSATLAEIARAVVVAGRVSGLAEMGEAAAASKAS